MCEGLSTTQCPVLVMQTSDMISLHASAKLANERPWQPLALAG
jgi:hypothetical protein